MTNATLAYFASRLFVMAHVAASIVFSTGLISSCTGALQAEAWFFVFGIFSTSFLFFFRVRAIFWREGRTVVCFLFLWITVLGSCMAAPFSVTTEHIGPTKACFLTSMRPYCSVCVIVSTVNDTLVFVAISLRLLNFVVPEDNLTSRLRYFCGRRALPVISETLLRSGQQYYLITVTANIVMVTLMLSHSIPPIIRGTFVVPYVVVENVMACKVFRDVRLGLIDPHPSAHCDGLSKQNTFRPAQINGNGTLSKLVFGDRPTSHVDMSIVHSTNDVDDGSQMQAGTLPCAICTGE